MKKLTAGIFATLLTMVSVDGAYAAIASSGYVDEKVGAVQTAVTEIEGDVSTLQTTVGEHATQIAGKADKATTLSGYGITDAYTSAQGTALEGRVSAVEAPKAQVAADVPGPVSGGAVYTAIQGVSGDVSGVTSDVGTLKTDMAQAKEDISALETASATHATKTELTDGLATKQDKLSQTGSASQPVYVNEQGVVTAGNTIPSVTTNITTGQTAAAQAGAVAEALAAKADATDLEDYVTETDANAAYAVKALEDQVGTVSAENMGTTATTVVTAIKEVAGEAADAATAASAADTKAVAAQGAAETAQADVDALEGVVNNEATGLAAAHTAIDALESGKLDKTGTAERAKADASGNVITTTYATKAEIADLATDENLKLKQDKTDDSLATTNKTVVGAINEVKTQADKGVSDAATAQSAAEAAQSTATKAQTTANAALPKETYNSEVGTVSATNMGTSASTVVTAIKEVKTQADKGVSDAATAKSAADAAQDAADAAQKTANAAIPKPDGECTNPTNKCVLTWNNSAYAWEVIERGTDGK